jgi:hypothetical protein
MEKSFVHAGNGCSRCTVSHGRAYRDFTATGTATEPRALGVAIALWIKVVTKADAESGVLATPRVADPTIRSSFMQLPSEINEETRSSRRRSRIEDLLRGVLVTCSTIPFHGKHEKAAFAKGGLHTQE